MKLFGYVWIVILVLAYIIWTIKSIIDFIVDLRSPWKLSVCFELGHIWAWWIMIHGALILIGSFICFLFGVV